MLCLSRLNSLKQVKETHSSALIMLSQRYISQREEWEESNVGPCMHVREVQLMLPYQW